MRLKFIPVTAPRLIEAAPVLSEIMATPDRGIPEDMLANAQRVVIVPGLKTSAFLVSGKYGKGYVSCCIWSRSQGLFAGLALEGATLRQHLDDNATLCSGARADSGSETARASQQTLSA